MLGLSTDGHHGFKTDKAVGGMPRPSATPGGAAEGPSSIELKPDRITIYADVEARFEAVRAPDNI